MSWKCLSLRAVSKKSVASFTPGSAASFTNANLFHILRNDLICIIGVPISNRQMKETAVDLESENCELLVSVNKVELLKIVPWSIHCLLSTNPPHQVNM